MSSQTERESSLTLSHCNLEEGFYFINIQNVLTWYSHFITHRKSRHAKIYPKTFVLVIPKQRWGLATTRIWMSKIVVLQHFSPRKVKKGFSSFGMTMAKTFRQVLAWHDWNGGAVYFSLLETCHPLVLFNLCELCTYRVFKLKWSFKLIDLVLFS